jgi:hypothetical protein
VDGDPKALLQTLDSLKSKLGSAVIVLGNVSDGKVSLIAGVSKDLTDRVAAPDLIALVGPEVGAKGGGRPDMARAGGGDKPDALAAAAGQGAGLGGRAPSADTMALIVQKYGGTSVGSVERIHAVADRVIDTCNRGIRWWWWSPP